MLPLITVSETGVANAKPSLEPSVKVILQSAIKKTIAKQKAASSEPAPSAPPEPVPSAPPEPAPPEPAWPPPYTPDDPLWAVKRKVEADPSDDESDQHDIGTPPTVETLRPLHSHALLRGRLDDQTAAAVVCYSKRWDTWMVESQKMSAERAYDAGDVVYGTTIDDIDHTYKWVKYVFGVSMFAPVTDLCLLVDPKNERGKRKLIHGFIRNNLVLSLVDSGGSSEKRCHFNAAFSSAAHWPNAPEGLQNDLGQEQLEINDLTVQLQEELLRWQRNNWMRPRLRRMLSSCANAMCGALSNAMDLRPATTRPLFRGITRLVEYAEDPNVTSRDGARMRDDVTSTMRSTTWSMYSAHHFTAQCNEFEFYHIFLIGDPRVRCCTIRHVLKPDLQCFADEQETILGADNILIPVRWGRESPRDSETPWLKVSPDEAENLQREIESALQNYATSRMRNFLYEEAEFKKKEMNVPFPRYCSSDRLVRWIRRFRDQMRTESRKYWPGQHVYEHACMRLFLVLPRDFFSADALYQKTVHARRDMQFVDYYAKDGRDDYAGVQRHIEMTPPRPATPTSPPGWPVPTSPKYNGPAAASENPDLMQHEPTASP